jgi:hypothetical protein
MALVTEFEKVSKERYSVHGPVECSYMIFTAPGGKRYLQLDTYGSRERQIKGKISQSIQLDAAAATELKRIIDSMLG